MKIRPSKAEKEIAFIEKCIVRTMRKFRESPRLFWSEDDVRCYLKQLLLKGKGSAFRTGRLGNVVLGLPTKNTYAQREDGALFASADGESERFALAGWSSAVPTTWNHVTQQLSFAIELKHFAATPENWAAQIRNCLLKLSDEKNGVPPAGRFFLLLTAQRTSQLIRQLNAVFAEFPTVRCYQQVAD